MIGGTQETSHETVAGSAISALTICQPAHKTMQLFYNHLWLLNEKFNFFDHFFLFPSVFAVKSKTGALEGPEVDGFVKDMMGLVRVSSLRCKTTVCLYSICLSLLFHFFSSPTWPDLSWTSSELLCCATVMSTKMGRSREMSSLSAWESNHNLCLWCSR